MASDGWTVHDGFGPVAVRCVICGSIWTPEMLRRDKYGVADWVRYHLCARRPL